MYISIKKIKEKEKENSEENTYMKVKACLQAYISENVKCNIFDKEWSYKENLAPNTQERVWRALLVV